MKFLVPVRTWSEPNMRGHWAQKARRFTAQRDAVRWVCKPKLDAWLDEDGVGSYVITLTRIAPNGLDTDNLAAGLKAVRDAVADLLGIDDGSALLEWRYAQRKGTRPREYAVEVDIELAASAMLEACP